MTRPDTELLSNDTAIWMRLELYKSQGVMDHLKHLFDSEYVHKEQVCTENCSELIIPTDSSFSDDNNDHWLCEWYDSLQLIQE